MCPLLNPASLLLGLLAWALPLSFFLGGKPRRLGPMLAGSGLACGAALLCQLVYISHLVRIRDWSALLDTADAVVFAAAVLVAATALLDLLALLLHRELTGESRP